MQIRAWLNVIFSKLGQTANETSSAPLVQPHLPNRCVLMWKYDGLCQRIVATIHGLAIAEDYDLKFRLVWVDAACMKARFDRDYVLPNDTPDDPRLVFSKRFLTQYLVDDKDVLYPPELTIQRYANGPSMLGRDKIVMNTREDFDRASNDKDFFGLAPHEIDDSFLENHREKCRRIVDNDFFSEEVAEIIADCRAQIGLRRMWAVHLRSGDVVYGDIRKYFPRRHELSMTVPIAVDICREAAKLGKKVIVLGASRADIVSVINQSPNAIDADRFEIPTANKSYAVIRDAVLMSLCEKLFSAKNSGVARMASYLGHSEWINIQDAYTEDKHAAILATAMSDAETNHYHNLQKAFILYTLFVLEWDKVSFDILDGYLVGAFALDPENLHYMVLRYLNCLHFSKFGQANRVKNDFLERASQNDERQGRNLTAHVGIRSVFMEKFLRQIDLIENLPDSDARRIRGWIERFYDTISAGQSTLD